MDVLLWVGWACTLVVLFFMSMIGLFGSQSMKSPLWDHKFLSLAEIEWQRRGLTKRKASTSEMLSADRMVGYNSQPQLLDSDLRGRTLAALQALTGLADRSAMETHLDSRGEELLSAALSRVSRSVQNISNMNLASRVWVAHRWFSVLSVTFHSLVWFVPLCFKQVGRVIERYMQIATVLGITGGLLWWGFGNGLRSAEGGMGWVNFVGIVVTVGTVVALVLAIGQQFMKVAVATAGPIRSWTKQRILNVAFVLALTIGMVTLFKTGLWLQWQNDVGRFVTEQLSFAPVGDWIGKALIVMGFAWAAHRALAQARIRGLKMNDRVTALSAVVMFTLLFVLFVLFILDAPRDILRPTLYVFGWALMALIAINAIFTVGVWIAKYWTLRRAGITVRRGWFRWWAVWAWIGSALTVGLVSSVPQLSYPTSLTSSVIALQTFILALALVLSFWPGVFTVIRFILRVDKTHERYLFDTSRASFDAQIEDDSDDRDP